MIPNSESNINPAMVLQRICLANDSPSFTEFQGSISPFDTIASACNGDVYLDLVGKKVFYFRDVWVEWQNMNRDHTHPTDSWFFLNPTPQMFQWSNRGLFKHHTRIAQQTFGINFSATEVISRFLENDDVKNSSHVEEEVKESLEDEVDEYVNPTPSEPQNLDFVSGLAGSQFPMNAPRIKWVNLGVETFAPFVKNDLKSLVCVLT
jgi:hypothetical protein